MTQQVTKASCGDPQSAVAARRQNFTARPQKPEIEAPEPRS